MKFLVALCVLVSSALAADVTQNLSSRDVQRASTTTGYVDYWQVKAGPCKLISLYGYNSGPQQWIQIFDCYVPTGTAAGSAVINITGFNQSTGVLTNTGGVLLGVAEPLQLTNTFAGLSAGIYYAIPVTTNTFELATDHNSAVSGISAILNGATAAGKANRVPVHQFAVAANDNYSCIVPNTGLQMAHGLLIANSTTGGTYTPGVTNLTICVTVGPSDP